MTEKAIQDIEQVSFRLQAGVVRALRAATQDAADHAKRTTLFNDRTGETRRSIEPIFIVNGNTTRTEVIAGGASFFLENGTKFMAARPFMTEARNFGELVLEYYVDHFVNEAIK